MSMKSAFEEIAIEFWYSVDDDALPTTDEEILAWVTENVSDEIVDTIKKFDPTEK